MELGQRIVNWYQDHGRQMPWRDTYHPYEIWIAEVILQQTRIEQGVKYYYRFLERFPDVQCLAEAEQDEVLKYWEGLGYYSRARNLHAAAKQLVATYGDQFPTNYQAWQELKGIGPYTARAIGSFAFGNETGVIDGNVLRVMSRVLGDAAPINQQKTRKRFQTIVDEWVVGLDSRAFNHGMMDIGATICTPTKPGCLLCPLETLCVARQKGMVALLPVKEKKAARKVRYFFFYFVQNEQGKVAIRQRPSKGIWGGLWEIPNDEVELKTWEAQLFPMEGKPAFKMKHIFTHFDMHIQTCIVEADHFPEQEGIRFVSPEEFTNFAFSKAVLKIFENILP